MSIAPKLQLILDTKAGLKSYLGIPNGVPFSQYVKWINWKGATPPADLMFADYTKDRYSVSGVPVFFSDVNEFTRLTAATNFVDGELVEYAANKPRIEAGKGLLVEPSVTNKWYMNELNNNTNANYKTTVFADGSAKVECIAATTPIPSNLGPSQYPLDPVRNMQTCGFILVETNATAATGSGNLYTTSSMNNDATYVNLPSTVDRKGMMSNRFLRYSYFGAPVSPCKIGVGTWQASAQMASQVGDYMIIKGLYASGTLLQDENVTPIIAITAPTTRSPDLLRLTIPTGKTLTLDADDGISYVMENATTALITATKPAYIRSARVN